MCRNTPSAYAWPNQVSTRPHPKTSLKHWVGRPYTNQQAAALVCDTVIAWHMSHIQHRQYVVNQVQTMTIYDTMTAVLLLFEYLA